MKKNYSLNTIFLLAALLLLPRITTAQDISLQNEVALKAIIGGDQTVQVNKTILLDASKTINQTGQEISYKWDFGDGESAEGIEATHFYKTPGVYIVTLKASVGGLEDTDKITVTVYSDLMILISDKTTSQEKISYIKNYAARSGVFLKEIEDQSNDPEYIVVENLTEKLLENTQDVKNAKVIISWTKGDLGLQALSNFAQHFEQIEGLDFSRKVIVFIVNGLFAPQARSGQSTFDVLKPEFILVTTEKALPKIIDSRESQNIITAIGESGIEHRLLGIHSQRTIKDLNFSNFMSYGINFLVNRGVPINSIILILMLPVVATIIALFRQIIGIKAFGIYTPSIITLSFLALGLKYGLIVFFVILIVGTIVRFFIRKIKILYLPAMAIILIIVTLAILILLWVGAFYNKTNILTLSVFPILIMISLIEKFIAVQIGKGLSNAIKLTLETVLLSIVCYFLVSWQTLRIIVLGYPEIIILLILLNLLVGRWSGLRLLEYLRFWKVIKAKKV